jgi:hypothetical protein
LGVVAGACPGCTEDGSVPGAEVPPGAGVDGVEVESGTGVASGEGVSGAGVASGAGVTGAGVASGAGAVEGAGVGGGVCCAWADSPEVIVKLAIARAVEKKQSFSVLGNDLFIESVLLGKCHE